MAVNFTITIRTVGVDNLQNLNDQVDKTKSKFKDLESTLKSFTKILKDTTIGLGVGLGIEELGSSIIKLRGQFQQAEVAMTTMLGSAEKAQELMEQMKRTAVETPFSFADVVEGTKQLLAYGVEADNVNNTLKDLGDIASGMGRNLGDLVFLYGTTIRQAHMYTVDLRQFLGRGIPIGEYLADQLGIAEDKLQEFVRAGKVTPQVFDAAIRQMANSKFDNLMEKQSQTISGRIEKIKDTIEIALADIGKDNESLINGSLDGIATLVANYRAIGAALATAVTAVGAYKGSIIALMAIEKAATAITTLHRAAHLLLVRAHIQATTTTELFTMAQIKLNKVMAKNPYVLAGAAIAALAVALVKVTLLADNGSEAIRTHQQAIDDDTNAMEQRADQMNSLLDIYANASAADNERALAINKLKVEYEKIFEVYSTEEKILKNLSKVKREMAKADRKDHIDVMYGQLVDLDREIQKNSTPVYDSLTKTYRNTEAYNNLIKYRDKLQKQISKEETRLKLYDASDIGEKELKDTEKALDTLLDKMNRGTRLGKHYKEGRSNYGMFANQNLTKDEIKEALVAVRTALDEKKAPQTYADALKKNAKELREAQQDMNKAKANPVATPLKDYEVAKARYDAAKKDYQKLHNETLKQSSSKERKAYNEMIKAENNYIKAKENLIKIQKELAEEQKKIEYDTEQARIDIMDDGTKKSIRQAELNAKKERDELEKQSEEYRKKLAEERFTKEQAEASKNAKGKKTANKSFDVAWEESEQKEANGEKGEFSDITLDSKFKEYYEARKKAIQKTVDDAYKQEAESMRNYLKEYGTIQQQRVALIEEWNEKIKKAKESGSKGEELSAEAGKKKALEDFDFQAMQKSPEYVRAFKNLDLTSTGTLKHLLSQFEDAMAKGQFDNSDPEALQKYVDVIQNLKNELAERNPFEAIKEGIKELNDAQQRKSAAQSILSDTQGRQRAEAQVRIAKSDYDSAVKSGDEKAIAINAKSYEAATKALQKYTKAEENLREAEDDEMAAKEKINKGTATLTDKVKNLGSQISSLGSTLGGTAGEIMSLIGNIVSFVTTISDSVKAVSAAAAEELSTLEKASVILTIIQAAIQLMKQLDELLPDAHGQYEDFAEKISDIEKMKQAVTDYKIAVAEAAAEEKQWFAGSGLRNLKDFAEIGKEATEAYAKKLTEQQAIYQNETGNGWLTTAAHWVNPATWISELTGLEGEWANMAGMVIDPVSTILSPAIEKLAGGDGDFSIALGQFTANLKDYEEGTTAALNNLRIETRKRSKGFLGTGIGGHDQETEDLISWTKKNLGFDLFNEDLTLNDEAYEVIMDKYSDKLVGQTKETLEALKEYSDKYQEYIEELEDYVSDLYQPLVTGFTDALWDWFDEGKDALDSFKDYASDVFRDIVTDMLQSVMLSDFIDQFSNTVKDAYKSYSSGDIDEDTLMNTVNTALDAAMQAYDTNIPLYQDMLENYANKLDEYGISLNGTGSSQSASGNAATEITQDQAEELNGRATAIEYNGEQQVAIQTLILNAVNTTISLKTEGNAVLSDIRTQTALANGYLADIQKDTRKMYTEWGEKITRMDKNINDKL